MDVYPLSIILIKSDSKGDRLLFRYPFQQLKSNEPSEIQKRNPYALVINEDLLKTTSPPTSNISQTNTLVGFSDEVLSNLFAVKLEFCEKKFELKVNDVRFVGLPFVLRPFDSNVQDGLLVNIVIALRAIATQSIVNSYFELIQKLVCAYRHENKRNGYVSEEIRGMTIAHDEGVTFENILCKYRIPREMKSIFQDLCTSGYVSLNVNNWINITHCLTQKIHQSHQKHLEYYVDPEKIGFCMKSMKPYHGLLLLDSPVDIANRFSVGGASTLMRLLTLYTPFKNFKNLSYDCDMSLEQIMNVTAHLVYWAKAIIIFPISANNKYVISPNAEIDIHSSLFNQFLEQFPSYNLLEVLQEFSTPTSLSQKTNPLQPLSHHSQLTKMIVWILQNQLLMQVHTYVQILFDDFGENLKDSKDVTKKAINSVKNVHFSVSSRSANGQTRTESESGASTISDDILADRIDNEFFNLQNVELDSKTINIQDQLLYGYNESEKKSILKIPASNDVEDLTFFVKLHRKGYFDGEHHLEEIMYLENIRRSRLLQILEKFRDLLIVYEHEDCTISLYDLCQQCSENL